MEKCGLALMNNVMSNKTRQVKMGDGRAGNQYGINCQYLCGVRVYFSFQKRVLKIYGTFTFHHVYSLNSISIEGHLCSVPTIAPNNSNKFVFLHI
jgi:hypothetical protein